MRTIKLIACPAVLACLALAGSEAHGAITLGLANVSGAEVSFAGDGSTSGGGHFNFTPGGGSDQFFLNNWYGPGGTGDSVAAADKGNMSGTYQIGTITTVAGVESAPVTGTGTLTIHSGSGDLTASLTWDTIQTSGTAGSININGVLNLASVSYSGSQQDLIALAAPHVGTESISFTFVPGVSLDKLSSSAKMTGFSGQLSAVPEPTTMLAGVLLLLPFGASTLRIYRKNRTA